MRLQPIQPFCLFACGHDNSWSVPGPVQSNRLTRTPIVPSQIVAPMFCCREVQQCLGISADVPSKDMTVLVTGLSLSPRSLWPGLAVSMVPLLPSPGIKCFCPGHNVHLSAGSWFYCSHDSGLALFERSPPSLHGPRLPGTYHSR